jgi:hypothetical protein
LVGWGISLFAWVITLSNLAILLLWWFYKIRIANNYFALIIKKGNHSTIFLYFIMRFSMFNIHFSVSKKGWGNCVVCMLQMFWFLRASEESPAEQACTHFTWIWFIVLLKFTHKICKIIRFNVNVSYCTVTFFWLSLH